MRVVMLGGAPGTGKSTVARRLLEIAEGGPQLVQWVDVDSLWLHQPWRADERMTAMMRANLRSVAGHAARAGVDVLLITWVFQSADMHQLVTALLPPASASLQSARRDVKAAGASASAASRSSRHSRQLAGTSARISITQQGCPPAPRRANGFSPCRHRPAHARARTQGGS